MNVYTAQFFTDKTEIRKNITGTGELLFVWDTPQVSHDEHENADEWELEEKGDFCKKVIILTQHLNDLDQWSK